jgi:hypothetical protein
MSTATTTSGGFSLQHDRMTSPPVHIPDGMGGSYKTELVIERSPQKTVKVLWWHADDPRPEPHNHPWDFESQIIAGGYTDVRYTVKNGNVIREVKEVRSGDINNVPREVFHCVTNVLPGTVTVMTCGEATPGNTWGYLDIETGEVTGSNEPPFGDPDFIGKLRSINPHMRQKS